MGRVVLQGPCPYCTSSDAYTEYDDGGYHCFSCHAHGTGNPYKNLKQAVLGHKKDTVRGEVQPLPNDATKALPRAAKAWLDKYGITDAEIDAHNFLWSESGIHLSAWGQVEKLLIFPIWNGNDLLMWQARTFSQTKAPKYITRGDKENVMHIIGDNPKIDTLVLTEDLLSAIKVGRVHPAMPLWGSHINRDMAHRIAKQYEKAYLFLDYDKRDYSIKATMEHCLILDIEPIIMKLDPKEYSTEEITSILEEHD